MDLSSIPLQSGKKTQRDTRTDTILQQFDFVIVIWSVAMCLLASNLGPILIQGDFFYWFRPKKF